RFAATLEEGPTCPGSRITGRALGPPRNAPSVEERAGALFGEPLADQRVEAAVLLHLADGGVEGLFEVVVGLAQADADATADDHVGADELEGAGGAGDHFGEVGAVGEDDVDIAGIEI